jgi:L-fuculose-phosphate aldolase
VELERLREEIVRAGQRMRAAGLVVATEGNLSARAGEGRVLATPAGADKGELAAEGLALVSLNGERIDGPAPSTELEMHLAIYRVRADVGAVVHGHPPHATAFAAAHRALDACVLPEVIVALGRVPLSAYGTPSTHEVPDAVTALAQEHDAFLLRNHGAVALGIDVRRALYTLETVERLAQITWLAEALGGVRPLDREQIERLMAVRAVYGLSRAVPPCRAAEDFESPHGGRAG